MDIYIYIYIFSIYICLCVSHYIDLTSSLKRNAGYLGQEQPRSLWFGWMGSCQDLKAWRRAIADSDSLLVWLKHINDSDSCFNNSGWLMINRSNSGITIPIGEFIVYYHECGWNNNITIPQITINRWYGCDSHMGGLSHCFTHIIMYYGYWWIVILALVIIMIAF